MPKAERALRALQVPEARYVMEVNGRYIVSYGCNNPAGLANDAGDAHANVHAGAGGRMYARRNIAIDEEIYWTYGHKYWSRWGPRLELPQPTRSSDEGGAGEGGGQGGVGAEVGVGAGGVGGSSEGSAGGRDQTVE